MKIKTMELSYQKVLALPPVKRKKPRRPSLFFRTLLRIFSAPSLKSVHFQCKRIGMERLGKTEPCLILMNHSSFIDLKIATSVFYPRPLSIVCTSDGFVGKEWLMRRLGCVPTAKFVTDYALVKDMIYCVNTLRTSVLMYPEASYSFDGTATPLPESVGKCLKLLGVPVVMIRTNGAFLRDPLYNNLQLRKTNVSAEVEYLLSPEDIAEKSVAELNAILQQQFAFDNFRYQQEHSIRIKEGFRADHLNRILYKCPHCLAEGQMEGKGVSIRCKRCGKGYELTEDGYLSALDGDGRFTHIPDWYRWEREEVRKEIEAGTYRLESEVEIYIIRDTKAAYHVGRGHLVHTPAGFHLTGCGGALDYTQKPSASYSLYSDFNWYELGDMICIGKPNFLYYCFPTVSGDVVAKARMAAEELSKLDRAAAKA